MVLRFRRTDSASLPNDVSDRIGLQAAGLRYYRQPAPVRSIAALQAVSA